MDCRLVILAIGALLLRPVAQCIPQLEPIRAEREGEESTSISADVYPASTEDESTEQPGSLPIANGTRSFEPGSLCRRQTDCAGDMVCLSSGTCGCPALSPLLLSYAESFTCVSPRRLNEPCLRHAQCSHGNKRALCLSSVCRCPSQFRASGDRSQCLPVTAAFNALSVATLPAVLLILGFTGLGILSYRRLYKTPGDKARDLQSLSTPLGDDSCAAYAMPFVKSTELFPERGSDAGLSFDFAWSRLHSFAENTTLGLKATKRPCQWPLPDSNTSCAMTHEEELAKSTCLSSHKHMGIRRQISSPCLASPSIVAKWLASRRPFDLASAQNVRTANSPPTLTLESSHPVPMQRTKVSTLSNSTLMPPRRANMRSNFNSSSLSSPPGTSTDRIRQGFWQSAMSSLHETEAGATTVETGNTATFLRKHSSSDTFTASELRAAAPKKYTSEKLGIAPAKQMRRTVSELGSRTFEVLQQVETEDSLCCYPGCRHVHFCAPTEKWQGTFGRCPDSYMKLFADEGSHHEGISSLLTCRQPTWPYQRVVYKGPYHTARTCEALILHQAPVMSEQMERPKQPCIFKEMCSCTPASGYISSRRHQAVTESTASSAAQYDVPSTSLSYADSAALASHCACSSCEPQYSRHTNCGTSPDVRRYRAPRIRKAWHQWRDSAQTPTSIFGERALGLGKASSSVSSIGTTSLAPTASTNLPLSLCTHDSSRTEGCCYFE